MSRAQAGQAMRLARKAGISLKEAWRRVKSHTGTSPSRARASKKQKRSGGHVAKGKKKRGGHKKRGLIMGLGVIDLAQVAYTASQMGAPEAFGALSGGDIQGAGDVLVQHVSDPAAWVGTVIGNIVIGFGGKMIRRFSPASFRKYL